MTPPARRRVHDRITGAGLSADAATIRCDFVTGPFDEAVRAMDRKWGVDRLPDLVSITTADRWGTAIANLNAAIEAGDVDTTKARVAACIRGLAVMDAEAEAAGHTRPDPDIWEVEHGGQRFGFIRDAALWQAATQKRPDLIIISLKEAAVAVTSWQPAMATIEAIKQNFPGAEVKAVRQRTKTEELLDDEIPF